MKKLKHGFTLIELLVAILIFSIIITAIYSTFSTGTAVWRRVGTTNQAYLSMSAILEDLAKELRNMINYKELELAGESDKVYFSYISNTITEDIEYRQLYRASYFIRPSEKDAQKFDLVKKASPLTEGGFDIDEVPEQTLVGLLDNFKIEYAYKDSEGEEEEITWKDTWQETDVAPRAMRISLVKGDLNLVKYVSIATGELTSQEQEVE